MKTTTTTPNELPFHHIIADCNNNNRGTEKQMVANSVLEPIMYAEEDEGGDLILTAYLKEVLQIKKTDDYDCPQTPQQRQQRKVYSKEFLQSKLSMGSEFEGPLTMQPKGMKKKKKKETKEEYDEKMRQREITLERIHHLVRQNVKRPYFTPSELETIYQNVYGEPILLHLSMGSSNGGNNKTSTSVRSLVKDAPNVRVEIYPKEKVTKIFWEGN